MDVTVTPQRSPKDGQVVIGSDGWIFLYEGTNDSYSYLSGVDPVAPRNEYAWIKAIQRRKKLLKNCVHLICPEKLAVFPDKVDGFVLDESRLAVRLRDHFGVVYPINMLRGARARGTESYSKTDTHFNDLGALVAAQACLKALGLSHTFQSVWGSENGHRMIAAGGHESVRRRPFPGKKAVSTSAR